MRGGGVIKEAYDPQPSNHVLVLIQELYRWYGGHGVQQLEYQIRLW